MVQKWKEAIHTNIKESIERVFVQFKEKHATLEQICDKKTLVYFEDFIAYLYAYEGLIEYCKVDKVDISRKISEVPVHSPDDNTPLSIKINIGGRTYPLTISREEEELIRKAASDINKNIDKLKENYAVKDIQDLLAMTALQYATKSVGENDSVEYEKLTKAILKLNEELGASLNIGDTKKESSLETDNDIIKLDIDYSFFMKNASEMVSIELEDVFWENVSTLNADLKDDYIEKGFNIDDMDKSELMKFFNEHNSGYYGNEIDESMDIEEMRMIVNEEFHMSCEFAAIYDFESNFYSIISNTNTDNFKEISKITQ